MRRAWGGGPDRQVIAASVSAAALVVRRGA